MEKELNIAIIGYGISGISAAIQLRRLGHNVQHYDRNDPPAVNGAGMLLHPSAQSRLAQLDILEDAIACGAPVRKILAKTTSGQEIMTLTYPNLADGISGLGIQRGTLHRLLSNADKRKEHLHTGCRIERVDPTIGMLVDSVGSRHGPFDLVVVADGAHSSLRKQLNVKLLTNRMSNSAALVCLVDDPNGIVVDHMIQLYDKSRHLSVWPVGVEKLGAPQRCSIAINIPLKDAEESRNQIEWRQWVNKLYPEIARLTDAKNKYPNLLTYRYADVELKEHVLGRVIFIGDAAHSMSPQLGIGAQLALDDAAILAKTIDQSPDVITALSNYQQTRPQQIRRLHQISRIVTPLFQSESVPLSLFRTHVLGKIMSVSAIKKLTQEILVS